MPDAVDFDEIVVRELPRVLRTLARLLGRRQNLEDLAQEVFLRLFQAIGHFRGEAQLSTYIYRIVLNVVSDERKRFGKDRQILTSLDNPEPAWHERLASPGIHPIDGMIRSQFAGAIEDGLALLSERERTCLVLFHQEGRSYDEIREILDLPIGTVKAHLHRGRERLRARVQELLTGTSARR